MKVAEDNNRIAEHVAAMEGRAGVETQPGQREQQQFWQRYRDEVAREQPAGGKNVGPDERAVSIASGAILGILGLRRASLPGLVCAGIGSMLVWRGISGHCAMYKMLGLNTAQPQDGRSAEENYDHGIKIATAMTINKPREELYQFWRNFENLPRFMEHLESVTKIDDRRSRWVAKAPRLLGGKVEWEAEITRDDANQLIAWQSLPGSTIDTAGQVRFEQGLGDRGTEVHVWMSYVPPAGRLGHWITSMLGENPKVVVREELRAFKRMMELGEQLTIIGQPHGTCTGQGKPYTESDWKPLFTT